MRHIPISSNNFEPFYCLDIPDYIVQIHGSILFHPERSAKLASVKGKYHGNSYPALAAAVSCAAFAMPVAAVEDSARTAAIGFRRPNQSIP